MSMAEASFEASIRRACSGETLPFPFGSMPVAYPGAPAGIHRGLPD
jgi:hypothetical protein